MTIFPKPKILIVYTGGTIGMIENPSTKTLEPFDFDYLIENVPKVKMLDYEISNIQFERPIDSSSMTPQHWTQIANILKDNYDEYDGFVILHGTDTMAYTASALSFMLENLDKPVIITGSQLPIGEVRTDGEENLITALQVAAAKDVVKEVAILFENFLWRGNRATKHSADLFNAFTSNNYPYLAHIGLGIHYNKEALWNEAPAGELIVHENMDCGVACLDLFPGIQTDMIRHFLAAPNLKGVVMRTYGAGNAPIDADFLSCVREAVNRGLVIVNVTQCSNGSVRQRYLTGKELSEAGVISGHDITVEAAITKLMYLFGLGLSPQDVRKYMEIPIRGELTN
jgi:L-asparaginase